MWWFMEDWSDKASGHFAIQNKEQPLHPEQDNMAERRARYITSSTSGDAEADRPPRQRLLSCPAAREALVRGEM